MELFRALGAFAEPPTSQPIDLSELLGLGRSPTEAEHTELFVFQLNPCASVYLGAEGMLGGEARDRIAGFWRAIGQDPPGEPDHLVVMLALAARLADFESTEAHAARREALGRARKALFWEHLASWLPAYLSKVQELGATPYAAWAELTLETLAEEAERLGPPEYLSIHLREAPPLELGGEDAESLARALLTPVRSGVILTRQDLASASRQLGTGIRLGERRFALQSLLEQDAPSTLTWCADHAAASQVRYVHYAAAFGESARFWIERAAQTERMLRQLVTDIGHRDTEAQRPT